MLEDRITQLIEKRLTTGLSEEEERDLQQWIKEKAKSGTFLDFISNEKKREQVFLFINEGTTNAWNGLQEKIRLEKIRINRRDRYISILRYSSAAAIIVAVALFFAIPSVKKDNTSHTSSTRPPAFDVKLNHFAILTIEYEGRSKILQLSSRDTTLEVAPGQYVQVKGHSIKYNHSITDPSRMPVQEVKLSTLEGQQCQLFLPDNSQVFINSQSTIYFPTVFKGERREVQLEGEGFFYVQANKRKPFIVKVRDTNGTKPLGVKVTGTKFNVNTRSGNQIITTLIEGSVALEHDGSEMRLLPGQQGILNKETDKVSIAKSNKIDWGYFDYEDATIQHVMEEVSLWYGVRVVYRNTSSTLFTLLTPRSSTLTEVLGFLKAGGAEFEVEGTTIIVTK